MMKYDLSPMIAIDELNYDNVALESAVQSDRKINSHHCANWFTCLKVLYNHDLPADARRAGMLPDEV